MIRFGAGGRTSDKGSEGMIKLMEKRMEDSMTEQAHLLMSFHLNGSGRLFGGQLLAWIDETAGIVGRRHAGCDVVTAAIDNLQFLSGAYRNDIIILILDKHTHFCLFP